MQHDRFASDNANDKALLDLLHEIEHDSAATQRSLARRLQIALGLTNAYLKRCARKGWVKMRAVPARRYAYYLTPKGFAEKSRLTSEYLRISLSFFRRAREESLTALQDCGLKGYRRVALYGDGELAEIATLAAREAGIELVGVLAPGSNKPEIAGLPIYPNVESGPAFDAILITESRAPQQAYNALSGLVDETRIYVLPLSKVHRTDHTELKEAAE